ncbi:MAG: serine/threonine protein kinase [Christensenellales bacterium]
MAVSNGSSLDTAFLYLPEGLQDRVTLLALLAGGEHREVYAAQDLLSGDKVILKWTDANSADDAAREHELLQKLSHESIPRAIAFAQEDGRDYLLRSFAQGDTLSALVERDGCFTPRRTAEIALSLCSVLGYLHQQEPPIIFKDIKAENIVLTANGKLSLIDFGIAREKHQQKDRDTRLMGSFPYASPEHLGFRDTDPRSDIFSLGRLMAYLSTGDVHGTAPDQQLQAIIRKCTRLEPGQRYANVQRLEHALKRMLNPLSRRETLVIALTALLVVAGGLAAVTLLLKTPDLPAALPPPLSADRREQEENMLLPVTLQALKDGKPYTDCVVSADGTHWYVPGPQGQAMLSVFPFREHVLRAAEGNREVAVKASILSREDGQSHALNLDLAPIAPELTELRLADISHPIPLPFEQTDQFIWTHPAEGVNIRKEGNRWMLALEEALNSGSSHLLMGKCANAHGTADVTILLSAPEAENPVLIHTAGELDAIRHNLNGQYALAADIDLSGIAKWTPIGDERYPFTGSLDGRGHIIKGLKVQQNVTGCAGLFGKTEHAFIRRVILKDPTILAAQAAYGGTGSLIGWQAGGLTEDCAAFGGSVYADVGYDSGVGGLVGINQAGMIRGCFASAWVRMATNNSFDKGENLAGGLVGMSSGFITLCGFAGELEGNCITAGITGFCDKGIITRCYSAGIIKARDYQETFAPGGIVHMLTRSGRVSSCAYALGTAAIGANVTRGGMLEGIVPLPMEAIQKGEGLLEALRLGEEQLFVSAPGFSACPLPAGLAALVAPEGATTQ